MAVAYERAKDQLDGAWWDDWRLLERVGRAMKSGDLRETLAAIAAWRGEWMGFIREHVSLVGLMEPSMCGFIEPPVFPI